MAINLALLAIVALLAGICGHEGGKTTVAGEGVFIAAFIACIIAIAALAGRLIGWV